MHLNAVERFDDGTMIWIITENKETGASALKPSEEIVFVANVINTAAKKQLGIWERS